MHDRFFPNEPKTFYVRGEGGGTGEGGEGEGRGGEGREGGGEYCWSFVGGGCALFFVATTTLPPPSIVSFSLLFFLSFFPSSFPETTDTRSPAEGRRKGSGTPPHGQFRARAAVLISEDNLPPFINLLQGKKALDVSCLLTSS